VLWFDATVYLEAPIRVTLGLVTRAQPVATPGFAASPSYGGVGTYPDIVLDYMSADNLLNQGSDLSSISVLQWPTSFKKAEAR
jgi:hypothetical protein